MTQPPPARKITVCGGIRIMVELAIEHTALLEGAMVKVTGLPEPPPDAATL
jgi:hypothetical protein